MVPSALAKFMDRLPHVEGLAFAHHQIYNPSCATVTGVCGEKLQDHTEWSCNDQKGNL